MINAKVKKRFVSFIIDSFFLLDSAFFPDRHAQIIVHGKNLGVIGVLHPNVIEQFGLKVPCSLLELNIEPFV